jgi:hypothetical protein
MEILKSREIDVEAEFSKTVAELLLNLANMWLPGAKLGSMKVNLN